MRLMLDSPVHCTDGPFGALVDIVVDPATRVVTHIVVEPDHRHEEARLVPVELAGEAPDDERSVLLRCTIEEAEAFEHVQHSTLVPLGQLPPDSDEWGAGVQGVLVLPEQHASATHDACVVAIYDRIPKGEVEISRLSSVTSADGHRLGRVEGFVVEDDAERVTHLLLEQGHFWGRREVTIPIRDVRTVESDEIELRLTKDEVGELPQIRRPR